MAAKIKAEQLNASIRNIPLPPNMLELPVSKQGFPVPFFVGKNDDGDWDFRVANIMAMQICMKHSLCWVCGQSVGQLKSFVTGPMCVVTHTTAEPASHLTCARYAAIACPFLASPRAKRNEAKLPTDSIEPGGIAIMHNPGVAAVLVTREWRTFPDDRGRLLIQMGYPERVEWYAERRAATRAEVEEAVERGLDRLRAADADTAGIETYLAEFQRWLPEQ